MNAPRYVLVVNAGSSSLKLSLLDGDSVLDAASLKVTDGEWDAGEVARVLARWPAPDAVGHRVVHGGRDFTEPVRIDDDVLARLRGLTDLAPLHQPLSLAGIDAVRGILPGVPSVACFDTSFHATLPDAAATYAVPSEWRERLGVRRYGFHGLSHAHAARRAAELTGAGRIVVAHLGAGASLCAVSAGRSVDTTMGFTPVDGLVMATRCGSLDPGLVLWLNTHAGIPAAEIGDALEHRSGLLALAGTADMREILAGAEDAGAEGARANAEGADPRARLALDVYIHRLCGEVAAMTASLGGLDALVFTGGVGENAPRIRELAVDRLAFLGLRIDRARNDAARGDVTIGERVLVVTAREDLEICRGTRSALIGRPRTPRR